MKRNCNILNDPVWGQERDCFTLPQLYIIKRNSSKITNVKGLNQRKHVRSIVSIIKSSSSETTLYVCVCGM